MHLDTEKILSAPLYILLGLIKELYIREKIWDFVFRDDTIVNKIHKWVAGCFSPLLFHFLTKCLSLISYVYNSLGLIEILFENYLIKRYPVSPHQLNTCDTLRIIVNHCQFFNHTSLNIGHEDGWMDHGYTERMFHKQNK